MRAVALIKREWTRLYAQRPVIESMRVGNGKVEVVFLMAL